MTRRCVQDLIIGWVTGGAVAGIWLATPCSSLSRAKRGQAESGWYRIRSIIHVYGLPDLPLNAAATIKIGTQFA